MALRMCTLEQKLAVLEREIDLSRHARRDPGSDEYQRYEVLKSIAADVRAQMEFPRNQTLGALERALNNLVRSKTTLGYDAGRMNGIAQVVVAKWPTIRMALQQFGEESCE